MIDQLRLRRSQLLTLRRVGRLTPAQEFELESLERRIHFNNRMQLAREAERNRALFDQLRALSWQLGTNPDAEGRA